MNTINIENINENEEIIKRNLRSYFKWNYATSNWFNSVRSELPIYCEALLRREYNFNDAEAMKNAAFHYKNLIMKGEYLILTIDNGQGEDFTNFGIRKESNNLIFDESVKLKLYMNRNSPEHVWDAFKLYAKKNNIAYTQ